jgi:FkbM family methyltransferase
VKNARGRNPFRWWLAAGFASVWRLFPVRGVGRLITFLTRPAKDRADDDAVISYRSLSALVNFDNPPEAAIFLWRSYESDLERVIDVVLRPGQAAIDIGANCGVVTLAMMAAVGPEGRVVSVDPSPLACARVQDQVALNRADNVDVICAALGKGETVTDYFYGRVGLGALPVFDRDLTTEARLTTNVTTVDALVQAAGIERLAFMKIDTDGSECFILEGARTTLNQDRPVVECEFFPEGLRRHGKTASEQAELLLEAGYTLLRPRFQHASRFSAAPARVRRFEPLRVEDLPRKGVENIVALHLDQPEHGLFLRRLTGIGEVSRWRSHVNTLRCMS